MKNTGKIAAILSNSIFRLNENELEILTEMMQEKVVKKGEFLLKEGAIAKDIYWVSSGMLRQFYYKDGRDITEHFACEGQGALCITSLFNQVGSKLIVEALENSTVFLMPYDKLIYLSEQHKGIAGLLRKLLEGSLIMSQEKADSWRFETVRERYERFLREYPDAAKRASVNHIASYLLMTPESLSRVRAGLL
ncbi:Crp/Fnr family transcriptional regulator [uncultured Draconibacterium sp.]|uniref:Crp/Fnr family transcriptional regulator n=1 Tax=uncultured Draconibacterium sp. TaxID=1573823 RepID=UPI0032180DC7